MCSIHINPYGYLIVGLNIDGIHKNYRVNRVVLETFKGSPPMDMIIPESDHISGNTLDNSIDNLQWLSKRDNVIKEMSMRNVKGEQNPNSKYTENTVHTICRMLEENKLTIKNISKETNVSITFVYDIKYKRAWKHISDKYSISNHNIVDVSYDITISKKINDLILNGYGNKEIRKKLNLDNNQKTSDILYQHRKRLNVPLKR